MQNWYVVHVLSSQEKKVKRTIEEQRALKPGGELIEKILLPVENVSEVKGGQKKILEKRLWPGYLLVKMEMTDDSWQFIHNTPGVIEFLGGEKPTALTEKEVEDILQDLESKRETVSQKHKFKVGSRVKIIDGVFVNFIGTVTAVHHDKGRLSMLVSIFGRDTRVDDLEFGQVEEVLE
jgi:transcriptional antiterminator NusG